MTRFLAATLAVSLSGALAGAPVQCGHRTSDENRTEDSPGDALWALALDFRAKGNEESARATMRFLVEKYPSNRHVAAAKAELGSAPPSPSK